MAAAEYNKTMKIGLRVSRIANQFFFISTLAAWHYSCRKDVRDAWIRATGKLTPREEKALAEFSALMRTKYGFRSPATYLGGIFYQQTDRTAWPTLERFVKDPKDYELLKKVFSTFDERFKKIWRPKSRASLKVFERSLREKRTVRFFDAVGSCFGGTNGSKKPITVIILFSPLDGSHTAAGGANFKKNVVTLELPDLKKNTWQLSYSIAVLGHEIGHMLFVRRNGKSMIANAMKTLRLKNQYGVLPFSTLTVLNEATTAAFAPLGALGQTFFSRDLAPLLFDDLPKTASLLPHRNKTKIIPYYGKLEIWFVWKLLPLAMAYAREKKPIDKNFVREAGLLLKTIVK